MTTILTPTATTEFAAEADGDDLWLSSADLTRLTGYELRPEGFCLDEACVPVPPGREAEFLREDAGGATVNLAAFWRQLNAAIVHDDAGGHWSIGDPPASRTAGRDSLEAPDFTLPDAAGELHSLSDYRGKKVLLASWASW